MQILKAMLHPNVETRVGAHHLFSALLIPSSNNQHHEVAFLRSGYLHEPRKWRSNTASTASTSALLEKLRRDQHVVKMDKNGYNAHDDVRGRDFTEDDWKQSRAHKTSPKFCKLSSIIDKTAGPTKLADAVL